MRDEGEMRTALVLLILAASGKQEVEGGRVPGLTTCTESQSNTESYSRSCPSKLALRVVLELLSGESLLHTGLGRLVSSPAHATCLVTRLWPSWSWRVYFPGPWAYP